MADKTPRRGYIPLGILLDGCGLAAIGFIEQYWGIFAALMVCGVGGAIFHPEGARYANLVSGTHKGVGLSIFSVGGNSGFAVGPLVVAVIIGGIPLADGVMLGGFGLHGAIIFAALACSMAALLYWRLSKWTIDLPQKKKAGNGSDEPVNNWRAFGVLSVCITMRSVLFLGFNTYLPLYWQNVFHQSAQTGSFILAVFCVVGVAFNLIGGSIADRWGFIPTVRVSALCSIPFVALFPFQQNPYTAAFLLIPVAMTLYAPFSAMVVLGQRYLARNMWFASGITLGVAISVGGMFTPAIGWVADQHGLPFAMHLLLGIAVTGAVASLFLKNEH